MDETPEVQAEVPTEKPEIIAEIKNQEDVQHPPQSSKKHTRSSSKFLEMLACLEVNIPLLKHLKDTPEYVKTMMELLLKKKTVKKAFQVEYESLHLVCKSCKCFGHVEADCNSPVKVVLPKKQVVNPPVETKDGTEHNGINSKFEFVFGNSHGIDFVIKENPNLPPTLHVTSEKHANPNPPLKPNPTSAGPQQVKPSSSKKIDPNPLTGTGARSMIGTGSAPATTPARKRRRPQSLQNSPILVVPSKAKPAMEKSATDVASVGRPASENLVTTIIPEANRPVPENSDSVTASGDGCHKELSSAVVVPHGDGHDVTLIAAPAVHRSDGPVSSPKDVHVS
ncbi:hypothetical protein PIB30_105980 [Stylosanthes scabra]|uniref:Uncharacterized protein n=1 Tax=Stylosanthes scabra TaxID=79078 RepID=A0ABU6RZ52_9FABA|nr:hypothetical protein [Stylosanthes scabra]